MWKCVLYEGQGAQGHQRGSCRGGGNVDKGKSLGHVCVFTICLDADNRNHSMLSKQRNEVILS